MKNFALNNLANTIKIQQGELSEGVYYYNVTVGAEVVVSEKLVIIR